MNCLEWAQAFTADGTPVVNTKKKNKIGEPYPAFHFLKPDGKSRVIACGSEVVLIGNPVSAADCTTYQCKDCKAAFDAVNKARTGPKPAGSIATGIKPADFAALPRLALLELLTEGFAPDGVIIPAGCVVQLQFGDATEASVYYEPLKASFWIRPEQAARQVPEGEYKALAKSGALEPPPPETLPRVSYNGGRLRVTYPGK